MITSMRGCVACNDLWPWPISSRSFGLGLENGVSSVASTVLDGFFPYLIQMITTMRKCVACDDLWPWPISSRSFDLDFENRVRSILFSVLDRLFPYLPQMINTITGCVACLVYNKILEFQFFPNFSHFSAFILFWLGIRYELVNSMDLGFKMNWSIVWVIMGRRGVSSERRRSSCSSFLYKHYLLHETSLIDPGRPSLRLDQRWCIIITADFLCIIFQWHQLGWWQPEICYF